MDLRIKLQKLSTIALCFLIVTATLFLFSWYMSAKANDLNDTATQSVAFENKLTQIEQDIAVQTNMLSSNPAMSDTNQDTTYTMELSALAVQSGIRVLKLNALPTAELNGVITNDITIEVQGDLFNIINFQKLIQKDRVAIIKSISLRQNNDLLWLARDFDNTKLLPWLEFKTQEQAVDIPLTIDEVVSTVPTISQLFNHGNMLCYLQIQYLS